MKRLLLSVIAICAISAAYAQSYMFIDSEKVFKSIPQYNAAIKQLDDMSRQYNQNIETAYASIEEMYNAYQAQKQYLSETSRNSREETIIAKEQEVIKYQEDIFGPEGQMMKRRIEMIKPIQDKVFAAINKYAEANRLGMVIDISSNASLLYYSPSLDKTEEIINLVK